MHCTFCFSLCHLRKHCPKKLEAEKPKPADYSPRATWELEDRRPREIPVSSQKKTDREARNTPMLQTNTSQSLLRLLSNQEEDKEQSVLQRHFSMKELIAMETLLEIGWVQSKPATHHLKMQRTSLEPRFPKPKMMDNRGSFNHMRPLPTHNQEIPAYRCKEAETFSLVEVRANGDQNALLNLKLPLKQRK